MKKFGAMLVTLLLLVTLCATALAAQTYYVNTPNGHNLNVRSWRDAESKAIGSLSYGMKVQVEEIYKGWAKIKYQNYSNAYVYASYLSRTKPSGTTSYTTSSSSGKSSGVYNPATAYNGMKPASYSVQVKPGTSASNINLRWGPSTGTPIMGVRRSGAILRVIAEDGTWCQVRDDSTGECGYMMKKFLIDVDGVVNVDG